MPTYDYRCESCGQTFEYRQSMNDPRLETCILEGCNGKVTRLLGTGAGIIFKGSGFYETDYRSESYKVGKEQAEKDATASTKTKETSKETKNTSKDSGSKSETTKSAPAPSSESKKPAKKES